MASSYYVNQGKLFCKMILQANHENSTLKMFSLYYGMYTYTVLHGSNNLGQLEMATVYIQNHTKKVYMLVGQLT